MIKVSAAIFAAALTFASAAHAQQPAEIDLEALDGPACAALTLSPNGQFDCIPEGEPTPGLFHFTTWEDNGSVIVRGYPLFDGSKYHRIDGATDYKLCSEMVDAAWNLPEFEKYDEIWCVQAGE